jgi:hypothetical protein
VNSRRAPPNPRMAADKRVQAEFLALPPADGGPRNVKLLHERASRLQLMRMSLDGATSIDADL